MTQADLPAAGTVSDRIVVLGKIAGAFGVQGWVKIQSYTDPIENIFEYDVLQLGRAGHWTAIRFADGRVTAKGVLAKLDGIDSPEAAREKVGLELAVWRSELPPAAPGEFYWSDLEGLQAVTQAGEVLGRVDHFTTTPAGTLIVIKGETEHMIPFVRERILKVELDAGRIVFDWSTDW